MALRDMDERGRVRDLSDIDYRAQFDRKWGQFTAEEQRTIDAEVERLLDALRDSPDPLWGSIMNTSIEGWKVNPFNGLRGDWTGTPWHAIWERHGHSDQQAALFFGNLWKLRIIERPEQWIGMRTTGDNPTFPIGTSIFQGRPELAGLNADAVTYWLNDRTIGADEFAVRVHHRVVKVRPFRNGNGRHARLLADIVLERHFGRKPFTWGGGAQLGNADPHRATYLEALRAADRGDISGLMTLCRVVAA